MKLGDLWLVLVVGVGWGLLAPATKIVHAAAPALLDGPSIAVARAAWAFPLYLLLAAVGWRLEPPTISRRSWAAIVGAGLVFGLGITVTYSAAALHTSVAHISFLVGISPVTNTAAAALAFRLPLGRRHRIALALGVVGVGLLSATQGANGSDWSGDLLMLAWLAAFALYAVLLRAVGAGVSPAFIMGAVGSVAMLAVLGAAAFVPTTLRGVAAVLASPQSVAWFFLEITLASSLLAQTTFAVAVRRMGVANATIGSEYAALTVGIAASLALRETWSVTTVAAGALLVAALTVTFVPGKAAV